MHGKEAKAVADPKILPGEFDSSLVAHDRLTRAKNEQLVVARHARGSNHRIVGWPQNDVLLQPCVARVSCA